jgi:predicted nucleic acid-binding protein
LAEVVVADAGPLIALARIGALLTLRAVFSRTLVTSTVFNECVARPDRPDGALIQSAVDSGRLELVPAPVPAPDWGLDAGEASAIQVARDLGAGLLMDDRAGRRVAVGLGIPVIGVLGVLILAKRAGAIPQIRPLVEGLIKSGYYLSGTVIDDALRLAGEAVA